MNPAENPMSMAESAVVESILRRHAFDLTDINIGSFKKWQRKIEQISKRSRSITARIDVRGLGSVPEVEALESYVQELRVRGFKFYTLGVGNCTSAGLDALLIGDPDGIYVTPRAIIRLHGSVTRVPDMSDNEYQSRLQIRIDSQKNTTFPKIAKRTGQTIEEITKNALRDRIYTPQEALNIHLIDGIYTGPIKA